MQHVHRHVDGLDGTLIEGAVAQLCALEPDATAVLLTGSYAKGTASVTSDLDLTTITPSPRVAYRAWFVARAEAAPLHVSAAATTADAWLARMTTPARWSFGFPAINAAVYLRTDARTRTRLGDDPSLRHPAAAPEVEDFLDLVIKAKRAASDGDQLGLCWFAQAAAALAPTLLIPINEPRIVSDRRDALDAAISLTIASSNFADDLVVSLGLTPAPGESVKAAITRLAKELLAFLRERRPDVDDQPEIARYLTDGTLERHLAQIE